MFENDSRPLRYTWCPRRNNVHVAVDETTWCAPQLLRMPFP